MLAHGACSACASKEQETLLAYHVSRQKSCGNVIHEDVVKEFEETMGCEASWHEPGAATEQVVGLMDKRD